MNAVQSTWSLLIGSNNFKTHFVYLLKYHKTPTAFASIQQFAQQPPLGHFPPLVSMLGRFVHLYHFFSYQSYFAEDIVESSSTAPHLLLSTPTKTQHQQHHSTCARCTLGACDYIRLSIECEHGRTTNIIH